MTTRRRLAVIAAWLVATTLLIVCARTIDWRHAIEMARTARPGWLALSVLANTAIICLWAVFWGLLVQRGEGRAGYWRMFEIVSVASSLMNTVPFGGGHASSVVLLVRRSGLTRDTTLIARSMCANAAPAVVTGPLCTTIRDMSSSTPG